MSFFSFRFPSDKIVVPINIFERIKNVSSFSFSNLASAMK